MMLAIFLNYDTINLGDNMSKIYICLIGDIVRSKSINAKERREFQKHFREDLEYFNRKYRDKITSKLTVTLGDEYQGLFNDALVAFELISYIQVKYPYQFRHGIAIGELYTDLNDISIGMDGPVWWKAREALNEIKNDKKNNVSIKIYGLKNKVLEDLINNSFVFINALMNNWKEPHKEVLKNIIETYGLINQFKQVEFAHKFNFDPSKVSRILKSTKFFAYVEFVRSLANLINEEVRCYD